MEFIVDQFTEKDNHLVYTNNVYISKPNHPYISINGFIFSIDSHPNIDSNKILMNKIQRTCLNVGLRENIKCNFVDEDIDKSPTVIKIRVAPIFNKSVIKLDANIIKCEIFKTFTNQIFTVNQQVLFSFNSNKLVLNVEDVLNINGQSIKHSFLNSAEIKLSTTSENIELINADISPAILQTNFNPEKMGIGGLDKEFTDILRRAFMSRMFKPETVKKLGINHVRGILLYGPPGCGKTLIARQIGKMVSTVEPKIVDGPSILNKYVGESEKNIRDLFVDAEDEQKRRGNNSQLHIIIMDELDSICKKRGSRSDSTGTGDSIVNQLLSKIDGVNSLNNILLIGMTNRRDKLRGNRT